MGIFVLEVYQPTLRIEYILYGIQAIVAVGSSNSFFHSHKALVTHPQAKAIGNFGWKPDCCIFWMGSAGYRL